MNNTDSRSLEMKLRRGNDALIKENDQLKYKARQLENTVEHYDIKIAKAAREIDELKEQMIHLHNLRMDKAKEVQNLEALLDTLWRIAGYDITLTTEQRYRYIADVQKAHDLRGRLVSNTAVQVVRSGV